MSDGPSPAILAPCMAAPVSLPTSVRSNWYSRSRRIQPTPNIAPSWNVAPTDPFPLVRYDARNGERSLDVMRWTSRAGRPRRGKQSQAGTLSMPAGRDL
jgi:putative SOS response-associated peptidase YedK